ncbi:hypothetical protein DFP72DRAFT_742987, partial [Ephemerocybe angulata]
SPCYAHFVMPPKIQVESDGNVLYGFTCKAHPSITLWRARHDTGTSNLQRHFRSCAPSDGPEAAAMAAYVSGSKYRKARHRFKVLMWIARRRRPYTIIADPELLEIFTDLHGPCQSPSPSTISRDMKEAHKVTKEALVSRLAAVSGKVHIVADGWTSPNTISFIGVVVQY